MTTDEINRIQKVIRADERERLAGMIEFYIMNLEATYMNKVVAAVLRNLLTMVDRNNEKQ